MAQQLVKVNGGAKRQAAQGLVLLFKARLSKPHACRQLAKNLRVGFGLAQRRNRRAVQQHVGVAIACVHIPVFQLGGGREDVVGIVGGVGLKMLQHHGEQVFALEPFHHLARVRRHRHRVAVVDDQRFDGRAE